MLRHQASMLNHLVALAGLLPICLLVARLTTLPWQILAARDQVRALSTKVSDASTLIFPLKKKKLA